DTRANGTFLTVETDRLAGDDPRPLRSGDRLLLGSYEIEATIEQMPPGRAGVLPAARSPMLEERLSGDPFPPLDADFLGIALPEAGSPIDFERTAPDNAPAVSQHFRPPRQSAE